MTVEIHDDNASQHVAVNAKPRLLVITSIFDSPYHAHRAPYSAQLIERLSQRFDIEIIRPIAWTDKWQRPRNNDSAFVNNRWNGIPIRFPTYWFLPKIAPALNGLFYFLSIIFALWFSVRRPQIIFSVWSYPDAHAALRWAKYLKIPCVAQMIGSDINTLSQLPGTAAGVASVVRSAAAVLCVSEALRRRVIELGAKPECAHTVYTGIELDKFYPQGRSAACAHLSIAQVPRATYIGNLKREKGVHDFIAALALLKSRNIIFNAEIIGSGAQQEIKALIDASQLSDCVTLRGVQPHNALVDWVGASNCVCLPSYAEGVPNVVLEAMACERSVVATNVGGIPEVVDDSRLPLVLPGDIANLASRLEQALATEENLTRFKVDVGDYDKMANIVESILKSTLADKAFNR